MMRSVSSTDPPGRLVATAHRQLLGAALSSSEATDAPTRRATPTEAEHRLRGSLHALGDALARVTTETDPLARHLGLRQLGAAAAGQAWDVAVLSRPEEQDSARALLREVASLEGRSILSLEPSARADLEVLLRREGQLQIRMDVVAQRDAAQHNVAQIEKELRSSSLVLVREAARAAQLTSLTRPAWQHTGGLLFTVFNAMVFFGTLLAVAQEKPPQGEQPMQFVLVASAVLGLSAGAWVVRSPSRRRRWLTDQIRHLTARHTALEAQAAEARETLARALALFERVDAECRAEERAAADVLRRHPAAQAYVVAAAVDRAT